MVNPPGPAGPGRRGAGPGGTFGDGRTGWLGHLGNVRNVVRQEMISRQLGRHLPAPAARILDVGAGQGTQSIRLARAGHRVLAVEPDPAMRGAFQVPSMPGNSTRRRRPIPLNWPRCWMSKNAWARPTRTGSWASSPT
jgi:hypothetical protein